MRLKSSPSIRIALTLAGVVLVVFNFLFAQLSFSSARTRLPSGEFYEPVLPRAELMRALFLNYSSFAADVSWVVANVNVGAARFAHRRLQHLQENAVTIRELDPRFLRLYEWFPAVWIGGRQPPTFADVEVAANFVRPGMVEYPLDTTLPFGAAMAYVGIRDENDEQRNERYRRIVEFLEQASVGENVHPDNPFTLAYHRRRLHSFETGESQSVEEEKRFYSRLYLRTADPLIKRRAAERLEQLGGPGREIQEMMAADAAFERQQWASLPYVPPTLFVFLAENP